LSEDHIVRAASIYANIPLNRRKQLGAVVKRSKEKIATHTSARCNSQTFEVISMHRPRDKAFKKLKHSSVQRD